MFCITCGARLPDNARFCFSCGAQVSQPQIPQAQAKPPEQTSDDPPLGKLTPEQRDQLNRDLAKAMLAPIFDSVDVLVRHAETGPVSADDVIAARRLLESYEGISGRKSTSGNNVLFIYQDAYTTYETHRQRWGKAINENPDPMLADLTEFVTNGLTGLMAHTSLVETAVQKRILAYAGITQFLEHVLLTELLLALKFAGRELLPQGKTMLIQAKGEEFVNAVLASMQKAFKHYLAEARKNT